MEFGWVNIYVIFSALFNCSALECLSTTFGIFGIVGRNNWIHWRWWVRRNHDNKRQFEHSRHPCFWTEIVVNSTSNVLFGVCPSPTMLARIVYTQYVAPGWFTNKLPYRKQLKHVHWCKNRAWPRLLLFLVVLLALLRNSNHRGFTHGYIRLPCCWNWSRWIS